MKFGMNDLERWANSLAFDPVPPQYRVVTAGHHDTDNLGRPYREDRVSLGGVVRSSETFRSLETPVVSMGCVGRDNWLVPTRSNAVRIDCPGRGVVRLTMEIEPDATADADAEIDLYLKPGADDSPDRLDAFRDLCVGNWPDAIALAGEGPAWPRRGVRPIWPHDATDASHPVRLLEFLRHPFADRFRRMPLAPVLRTTRSEAGIGIDIRVGSRAPVVQKLLEGKLFLNRLLCWNRVLHIREPNHSPLDVDKPAVLEGGDAGGYPLVLRMESIQTSDRRFDARFAALEDPVRLYRLVRRTGANDYEVAFLGSPIPPNELRVHWLTGHRWPPDRPGEPAAYRNATRRVWDDSGAFPDRCHEADTSRRLAVVSAAIEAEGRADFEGAPNVPVWTRKGLRRAIARLMPTSLRGILVDGGAGATIATAIRTRAEGDRHYDCRVAGLVTELIFRCLPGVEPGEWSNVVEGFRRALTQEVLFDVDLAVRLISQEEPHG